MQKRHFCPFWGNFSFHFPSLSPLPPITDTRIPQSLLPTHCYCCCFFTSPCDALVVGDEISFIFLSTQRTHLAPHLVHVRVVAVCNQVLIVCRGQGWQGKCQLNLFATFSTGDHQISHIRVMFSQPSLTETKDR